MAIKFTFFASLLVVFSYSPILVDSQAWWSLGVTSCAGSRANCETCATLQSRNILTADQGDMCASDSSPVQAMARGTRQAIIECQRRFECRRWNCSTFQGINLFGAFVTEGRTRETAVLYGYLTAGATQAVAEACHEQRIQNCPCTGDIGTARDDDNNIIITSCSDNLPWALDFIMNFVQPPRPNSTDTNELVGALSDEHNLVVGGQSVNSQERVCVCHGLSGSCSAQTCYERAPQVSEIGESLYTRYEGAVRVELVDGDLQRASDNPQADPLTDNDLTYIDDSPDFCTPNTGIGILGTQHRECDISPNSVKSCSVLCCGRGYYPVTYIVPVEECVFVYCCRIECTNTRNDTITEYRCNE